MQSVRGYPRARSSLSKNLVEFAPAGAKKVQSFSSATCAAKKIPLGLQTCAPAASGGQRVRCSQAANPFVKEYYFLTVSKRARVTPAHARPLLLLTLPVPAPPRAYRQCSRRSPWRGLPAVRASPRRRVCRPAGWGCRSSRPRCRGRARHSAPWPDRST